MEAALTDGRTDDWSEERQRERPRRMERGRRENGRGTKENGETNPSRSAWRNGSGTGGGKRVGVEETDGRTGEGREGRVREARKPSIKLVLGLESFLKLGRWAGERADHQLRQDLGGSDPLDLRLGGCRGC